MEDEKDDLKQGETPSENSQSDNEVEETTEVENTKVESTEEVEETESEEADDEKVTLTKAELQKLQDERDNYKKGLLSLKNKGRNLPGDKVAEVEKKETESFYDDSEYVTKRDLQKKEEKNAIALAVTEIPELDDNWDEIVEFYYPKRGKDDAENIIEDLRDAVEIWKFRKGAKPKADTESKKVIAKASTDNSISKGKEKSAPVKSEGKIIKPTVPMERWYS